ncbi:hypothetical protein NP493_4485g00000 [Ridgeia piscesae]|uniref:Uncharacterized protein n=1 Tax=Ridgeia piscesae TaxID=27915 RepID=A0AAD9J059_RIDPI|nr:hypothetical protein NP493_4485g00000 [Ridgeia piscesae]
MPGGRNSGAVYSLYKVKYRKPGRTADASSRRTTARRLKSVGGVGSSSKHSRSLDQADRTGQKLCTAGRHQATPDTPVTHVVSASAVSRLLRQTRTWC